MESSRLSASEKGILKRTEMVIVGCKYFPWVKVESLLNECNEK